MSDTDRFYEKLRNQLKEATVFPADYLYKFIVPSGGDKVAAIQEIFNEGGAVIKTKKSKTGKYISVSILLHVQHADEIIAYYKKTSTIEGIISL